MDGLIGRRCFCGHILMPVSAPDGESGLFCPNCRTIWVKNKPSPRESPFRLGESLLDTPEATNVRVAPDRERVALTSDQKATSRRLLASVFGGDDTVRIPVK